MLIERGADACFGLNLPLRLAIDDHEWEVAAWLIEHGADVHANNEQALREVRKMKNDDFVRYVCERGGWRTWLWDTRLAQKLDGCTIT